MTDVASFLNRRSPYRVVFVSLTVAPLLAKVPVQCVWTVKIASGLNAVEKPLHSFVLTSVQGE